MSAEQELPHGAWRPDPLGRHEVRYWSGSTWTEHVADQGVTSLDPLVDGPTGSELGTGVNNLPGLSSSQRGREEGVSTSGAGIVVVAGSVLLGLGSALPWAKVSAGIFARTASGTDGDGVITLAIAVVVGLVASLGLRKSGQSRNPAILGLVGGIAAGGVSIYDTINVENAVANAESSSVYIDASVGIGLYLCILASALIVIGSLTLLNASQGKAPTPSTT